MVAEFMGDFRYNAENYADDPPRIVAHFHEWMAGVGLIMTRSDQGLTCAMRAKL